MRIVTWNLLWGLGYPTSKLGQMASGFRYLRARKDREVLKEIAQYLKPLQLDVLCVQEVDNGSLRNGNFSHVDFLSQELEMHATFAQEKGGYCNDGNALLSRDSCEPTIAKLPYTLERRNCIIGTVDGVTIVTTHFGAHSFNHKERMRQARSVVELLERIDTPVVVAGDLNCEPGSEPYDLLISAGLEPVIDGKTYPSFSPVYHVDHILTRGVAVKQAKLLPLKLSDHLGVYVEIENEKRKKMIPNYGI